MRTFKVTTEHDVYIDDFKEGEKDYVNSYTITSEIEAETPKEAIEKHYKQQLYFEFSFEYCQEDEEEKNKIHYCNLVDVDNCEATEEDKKLWKKGKKTLYANNTVCTIQELINVEI